MASGPPIATVYVRNLHERVKPEVLRETLEAIFGDYGRILEIVAKTNVKAKGQAFVVFEDPASAQRAIEEVQGFEIFEKPMQLAMARTRSDATVKRYGTDEDFEVHKRRRIAEMDKKKAIELATAQNALKRPGDATTKAGGARGLKSTAPGGAAAPIPDEYLPPNKTLFVQNLPEDYDAEAVTAVFGRFEGFREVRLVPGRKGIAFVEYNAEGGAISAKESTAGMPLGDEGKPVKVTYQRQ